MDSKSVITPGGPRPQENVHPVAPGQVVHRTADGGQELLADSSAASTSASEPAIAAAAKRDAVGGDALVVAPGGKRHPSLVHKVEPGSQIRRSTLENHVCVFGPSGTLQHEHTYGTLAPRLVTAAAGEAPKPADNGWITYSYWNNPYTSQLARFATTWQVPAAPAANDGQTVFIFNGIQNGWILQPVLQWGPSADGGGGSWYIASWYVSGPGGGAYFTPLVAVNPGDTLTGVITIDSDLSFEWAPQTPVQNVATSYGPSLTAYQGGLFMAWKGDSSDQGIWFARGGPGFSGQQKVPNVLTSVGPAVLAVGNTMYMAWKGMQGDSKIWWSTFNGTNWAPQQVINGFATSGRPALAEFNGTIYMTWKGADTDEAIYWGTYTARTGWSGPQKVQGVATSEGTTMAVYNGKLHMTWKGDTGDNRIWWSTFDGSNWAPQQIIAGVATSQVVSLSAFGALLFMAWKGAGSDEDIWWTTFDGQNWKPQQQITGTAHGTGVGTSVGPSLAALGSELYMAWKGANTDEGIWWSVVGGGQSYQCQFEGYPSTVLAVTDQEPFGQLVETLECYNINNCTDYPATGRIPMRNILVTLQDGSNPTVAWNAVNVVSECGQHTEILSNNTLGQGEVDLCLSVQQVVPNVATNGGPALAVFRGVLHMAWRGANTDERLWHSTFDGSAWAPQDLIPAVWSSDGPALAVYQSPGARGDGLFMAWKGADSDQRIWWTKFDGSAWAAQQLVPGVATSNSPALAAFGSKLYMAWKGEAGDQAIWFSTFDGTAWASQQLVSGMTTSVGPALAAPFGGALFMAWKGASSDQDIWWSSNSGGGWAVQQAVQNVGTSVGPSLAVFGSRLYAAWKGMNADNSIWWSSFDERSWALQQQVPRVGTSNRPALAVLGGNVYMAWKGFGSDQGIWWSRYDGTLWE